MKRSFLLMLTAVMINGVFFSCSKDDDDNGVVVKSRFTVTNDDVDGFKVNIINDSENATSYEWNFGDESATGTQSDQNFSYTYAEAGTYTITLTAKNGNTTDVSTKQIVVSGMTFKQFLSGTGAAGKVWHLDFTYLISMYNPSNLSDWWYGWSILPTAQQRNTVRHHEYIFKPDGSFEFKTQGFTVRPGTDLLFGDAPSTEGWADDVSWISGGGKDCSTWGNNANLTFTIGTASKYSQCTQKITLNGNGGHIGPMDTGTENVIGEPAAETFYEVLRYTDGGTDPDTVILYTPWGGNENGVGTSRPALGIITLVSYKDPGQIPDDEVVVDKPLETHDISETFETAGTMTWVPENCTEFVEDFDNPVSSGINTSAKVGKYQRGTSDYANLQFVLSYRMDLSTRNVFKMKVYIDPAATVPTVSMKLQNTTQGWETQAEIKHEGLSKGQWIELEFNYSNATNLVGVSVPTVTNYDKIVVQFGDEGANKGDGLFYFDDLILQ